MTSPGLRPRTAAFLLLVLAAACGRQAPAPQSGGAEEEAIPVVAQPAQRGALRATVRASGTVTPSEGAEFLVFAPETAAILEITRMAGDAVASGDVLVRFALPSASGNVARQQAEVATAQALAENARISQARTRDFVERGLVARNELDALDREVEEARAALARAQAALQAAEEAAARGVARAPFDGVVAARLKNPGDVARGTAADPVLRLVDPRRLEVTASIAVADAARVLPGATARLAGPAGGVPVPLTVAAIAPPVPGGSGMTPARLVFVEPTTLAVDTPVELDIDAEERADVVFVPPEAIVGAGAAAAVYVAVGGQAQRRPVTTGISEEERVEIVSGVEAGDLVITRGHTNLPDGAAISVALAP